MKYKVLKNSVTFKKLMELKKKAQAARKAAGSLVEKLGAENYCPDRRTLYGGISAVQFDKQPDGWKIISKQDGLYFPKNIAANKKLLSEIEALPKLQYNDLNSIVGFSAPQYIGLKVSFHVGLDYCNGGDIIISVTDGAKFKPSKDLKEILQSEYLRLTEEKKKRRVKK